jgi:hypothetical protein
MHRLPIELLVIGAFKTWPLDAEIMRHFPRRKQVSRHGVTDTISRLPSPEIVGLFVRLRVDQGILIHSNPIPEATFPPDFLIEGFTLLGCVVKGVALAPTIQEAGKVGLAVPEQLWIVGLDALLLLNSEVTFAHGYGEVRGSLEDLEVPSLRAPGLCDLHTRGTGADDSTALAFYINFLLGPKR